MKPGPCSAWREKRLFGLAWLLILVTSGAANAVPVLLGQMVDAIQASGDHGSLGHQWVGVAILYLALIGGAVPVRETFQAGSKYIIRRACGRIDRDLTVGLVGHLFRENLLTLSKAQVGGLHGRAMRSIEGFIAFLKVAFKDFFPAALGVATALAYGFYRQPILGLAMLAAIPTTLLIASRQLAVQKPLHLELLRARDRLDGMVVEQLQGIEYIRAADTLDDEMQRVRGVAEQRHERETAAGPVQPDFRRHQRHQRLGLSTRRAEPRHLPGRDRLDSDRRYRRLFVFVFQHDHAVAGPVSHPGRFVRKRPADEGPDGHAARSARSFVYVEPWRRADHHPRLRSFAAAAISRGFLRAGVQPRPASFRHPIG